MPLSPEVERNRQLQRPAFINDVPFYNVLKPLKNGDRSGRGQFIVATFSAANTDTDFATALGRIPNIYFLCRASVAGTPYDATDGNGHWTGTNIRLRASAIGTYTLWIC